MDEYGAEPGRGDVNAIAERYVWLTRREYFVLYFQVLQSLPDERGSYRAAWEETEELVRNLTGVSRYVTYESFKVGKTRYFAHGEHL